MGWRDRDYARFTEEERRRFFGAGSSPARRGPRTGVACGSGAAVLVSGLLALGRLPNSHPLVPALHFDLHGAAPTLPTHRQGLIRLPASVPRRSLLTIGGRVRGSNGRLATLEGRWNHGRWRTIAVRRIAHGRLRVRFRLSGRGRLALRLTYSNGTTAVGSTYVR